MVSVRLSFALCFVAVLLLFSTSGWAARGEAQGFFSASSAKQVGRLPDSALPGKARHVRVNQGMLRSGRILLNLGVGPEVELNRVRSAKRAGGASAWIGQVSGDPDSEVILASKGSAVSGTIRYQGRLYKLEPVGRGEHVLSEVSSEDPYPEIAPIPVPHLLAAAAAGDLASGASPSAQGDAGTIVDVMVVYTPASTARYGGTDGIESLIALAVEEANQAYQNSQVDIQLRLVHTAEVSYTESGSMNTDLDKITGDTDGVMDEVHTLRDAHGADLVSLFVESKDYCGLAWQMATLHPAYEAYAFSVVYTQCATGYYSFAHELGHNMGSAHDRANAGSALYPHSYGHQDPGSVFRTVMAYDCASGCVRVQHFSNPDVDYAGVPTGVADLADNALSLSSAVPMIATWRAAVGGVTPPIAPTDLAAAVVSHAQIDLAWTDNASDESGFRIERSENGVDFAEIAAVEADVASYSDNGLTPEVTYYYRVSAYNGSGNSDYSNDAWATTDAAPVYPPVAPSGLVAVAASHSEIVLDWIDNSGDETGFELERSQDGGLSWGLLAVLTADAVGYVDQGLPPETSSSYRVRAINEGGVSEYSNVATATTEAEPVYPPAAPSGLSAAALSDSEISLSWSDNAADEIGFEVERSQDGGLTWTFVAGPAPNATDYMDQGLSAESYYLYRVRALGEGGLSDYSNEAGATTEPAPVYPPVAPSELSAAALSDSEISLAWSDNATDETGFEVERSQDSGLTWVHIASPGPNATSYLDQSLSAESSYLYRVRALGEGGPSSYSNEAEATTEAAPIYPPVAPSGLSAAAESDSEISLAWSDNSADETGFEIESSQDGGQGWVHIASVAPNTVGYTDQGLGAATSYLYRVRAMGEGGPSGYSNEAGATTEPAPVYPPAAPSGLSAAAESDSEISLSWSDNSADETGFEIESSQDGGQGWVHIASVAPNAVGYLDQGLSAATSYLYRVRALGEGGPSGYSNEAEATTEAAPVYPPVAPNGLSAAAESDSEISLAWNDNSSDETGFEVDRSEDGGQTWTHVAGLSPSAAGYMDQGLSAETYYLYRVRALGEGGPSGYSNEAGATTEAEPVYPPAAPSGLSAAAESDSEISLAWNDNAADETGFEVARSGDGGLTWTLVASVAPDATGYMDQGLSAETYYRYRVRALGEGGPSEYSNEAGASTEAAPVYPPAAPSGLSAAALSDGEISLAWNDNATDETGFAIERSDDGGLTWALAASLGVDATAYLDQGLSAETHYLYRVSAHGEGGPSGYSNEAGATTAATPVSPPSVPSGLSAASLSDSEISLAWSDNAVDESGFEIERSDDGGVTWLLVAGLAPNTTEYLDQGLNAQTYYLYRVRALGEGGPSGYSNEAGAATEAAPVYPPEAPSGLSAAALSDSDISLTWSDNAVDESGYEIERSDDSGRRWAFVAGLAPDTTGYLDQDLGAETHYRYRIRALGEGGPSGYSNEAGATTESMPVQTCSVSGTFEGVKRRTVTFNLSNFGSEDLVIESVSISWPKDVNGNLRRILLGRSKILSTRIKTSPVLIDEWAGKQRGRTLEGGDDEELKLRFRKNADTDLGNYVIDVTFDNGCTLALQ